MTPAHSTPCVIYLRVSTREQGDSKLGLLAQEESCRQEAARRGWIVEDVLTDVISSRVTRRPSLEQAMTRAAELRGVMVVAKDDRASRSTIETLLIHDRASREGWHFYACNMPQIDTTTPDGRFMATIFAAFAELERARISERTKAALAQARKHGTKSGRPIGRPREMSQDLIDRMKQLRRQGKTYEQVADAMNEAQLYGPRGGVWKKKDVWNALKRHGSTSKEKV